MKSAAKLIGVDPDALEECFTTLTLRIIGQSDTKRLRNKVDAAHARNAMSKFVYSKMFDYLVDRVNQSMGVPDGGYDGMTCGFVSGTMFAVVTKIFDLDASCCMFF